MATRDSPNHRFVPLREIVAGGAPPVEAPIIPIGTYPRCIDDLAYVASEAALAVAQRGDLAGVRVIAGWRARVPPATTVRIAVALAEAAAVPRPARWVVDEFAAARAARGINPWQIPADRREGGHARWWEIRAADVACGAALRLATAAAPAGAPAAADILAVFAVDALGNASDQDASQIVLRSKWLAQAFAELLAEYHGGAPANRLHSLGGSAAALAAAAAAIAVADADAVAVVDADADVK